MGLKITGKVIFTPSVQNGEAENSKPPVEDALFSGKSFDVSAQDSFPSGVTFNDDGSRMYMIGFDSDSVYQYNLTSPFDVSTASFSSGDSFDISGQDGFPTGVALSTNGTRMFVVGSNNDSVYQYNLSTAFDITTASFSFNTLNVGGQDGIPSDITFNGDGTRMFLTGSLNTTVYQYNLSTGFDLSTASFSNNSFDVSSEETSPRGITFNNTGDRMFVIGFSDKVYEYSLTTGFDITTASLDNSFDTSSEDDSPTGLAFNDDFTRLFVMGSTNKKVFQYNL